MKVIGYDTLVSPDEIKKRGLEPVSLAELYAKADFISFHLPLTPESKGMVNGQVFAQMKRGVRIVDAARGGIIDETALLAALESGQVAAAALDVFATEPPGLTALVAHPNVVATPTHRRPDRGSPGPRRRRYCLRGAQRPAWRAPALEDCLILSII